MRYFKDEKKWLEEETKPIEKIHPFFRKNLLIKSFILFIILALTFRFPHIFLTLIFSLSTSYIKFKRMKYEVPFEIEPSYLFMVVLSLSYGFWYGFFFFIVLILPAIIRGISIGLILNTASKTIVLIIAYLVWVFTYNPKLVMYIVLLTVFLSDIISYNPRLKGGQPVHEIVLNLFSNIIIRYIYFSFFFLPLMAILA